MRRPTSLLIAVLRDERAIAALDLSELDLLIREARVARLLPYVAALAAQQGAMPHLSSAVAAAFDAANVVAAANRRALSWELKKLAIAFADCTFPVVLLKGAAYRARDLPFSRSRLCNDIDLLVPAAALAEAEKRLLLHGWLPTHLDAYDQRYYREWMHEIPPLRHLQRQSIVDLHHTIAPPVGRLPIDAEPLLKRSVPISETPPFRTLAPVDQILHSATHLMLDSEFDHALRDLIDIRELILHYGSDEDLLVQLATRAQQLGLSTPWHDTTEALRAIVAFPPLLRHGASTQRRPPRIARALVQHCIRHAFIPDHASCKSLRAVLARRALYVRSHYLKMPLHLLLPHLFHKAFLTQDAAQTTQ